MGHEYTAKGHEYRFTVLGQPIPKGRPRHTKYGGTYTPERTVNGEARMAAEFRRQVPGYGPPRLGPFFLSCAFYISRDDSDIDNLLKLVMDGLQGVAWVNDKQIRGLGVCFIEVDKENPRTEISFQPAPVL